MLVVLSCVSIEIATKNGHRLVPALSFDVESHKILRKTHIWSCLDESPEVRGAIWTGQLKAVGAHRVLQMSVAW
jgi:hypothetical protein